MSLSELLDVSVLRRLAEANYSANGMPIVVADARDGSMFFGVGQQDLCTKFHRVHPTSAERCRESEAYINERLSGCATCENRCRNGLRDIGIPVLAAGRHVATLFLGQFLYDDEPPDRVRFLRQAREFGFDEAAYLRALERVPLFSRAAVENILAYDKALARIISDLADASLRQKEAAAAAAQLSRFPAENPGPVLRLSSQGKVLYANEAARTRLRPLEIEEGVAGPPELAEPALRAAAAGTRVAADVRCGADTFSLTLVPVAGEVNVYGHEITSRIQAEEALRRSEAQARAQAAELEAILNSIGDGVIVYDQEGRTTRSTPSADRILGIPLAERREPVRDRAPRQYEVLSEDGRRLGPDEMAAVRAAVHGETIRSQIVRIRVGTEAPRWIRVNATPLVLDGAHAGAVLSISDVTDRKLAEEALREADRRKDEFLGMLSHELRNPLAPIRNSIFLLRHADPGGEQARRACAVLERQTEHLTRLVDDLLDVTRIAHGKMQLRREPVDLREVLVRAAEDFRLTFEDRGIAFRTELSHAPVWAEADPTRMAQVVGNLLHNAAKFTKSGDDVVLSLREEGRSAEIRVRDSGAGIDGALLPRVFEPFVQEERSLARTQGGLGLGLALVRGVAVLHGGSASVESGGKGMGAEFTIRLPTLAAAGSRAPARAESGRGQRRRVLVVDDNADAAESLADVLRLLGHDVEVAFDGPSAVEKARATLPDAVLCDIGLPGMDGYDVARTIRAERGDGVALFAVSGYAQPEDVKKVVEAGCDGHVAKPPDPAEIERLVR